MMGLKRKLENYFQPMLCEDGNESFLDKKGYVAELKADGTRCIAEYLPELGLRIYGRRGLLYNSILPEITADLEKIPNFFVLDSEIVYIDEQGHMVFSGSQKRCQISNPKKVAEYRKLYPVGLFVLDMPILNGINLMSLPWFQRRQLLEHFLDLNVKLYGLKTLRPIPISYNPREMYNSAVERGYEGIVMKLITSPYVQKRSHYWLKIKAREHTIFVLSNGGTK